MLEAFSDDDESASGAPETYDVDAERGFLETRRPPSTEPFMAGTRVDVFVDGARGLPDNLSLIHI